MAVSPAQHLVRLSKSRNYSIDINRNGGIKKTFPYSPTPDVQW